MRDYIPDNCELNKIIFLFACPSLIRDLVRDLVRFHISAAL